MILWFALLFDCVLAPEQQPACRACEVHCKPKLSDFLPSYSLDSSGKGDPFAGCGGLSVRIAGCYFGDFGEEAAAFSRDLTQLQPYTRSYQVTFCLCTSTVNFTIDEHDTFGCKITWRRSNA